MDEKRTAMYGDLVWCGKPYDRIFYRQYDLISSIMIGALCAAIALFSIIDGAWFMFALSVVACAYTIYGRFIHDVAARSEIRYELRFRALIILRANTDYEIRVIPVEELSEVKPDWAGKISSISLPMRTRETFTSAFNEWNRIVPASQPTMRLELIENADEVVSLMHRLARNIKTTSEFGPT